ncbi:hypothetical protein P0136_00835 [Lentisphaerota bacterium ZTH]|nr:hypothetical protein JYG24_08020 [Lentisphaerota bacterium]WET06559.1 hypothetical protein P0136_00835 [Lentisphaerota bacterium ZTH]
MLFSSDEHLTFPVIIMRNGGLDGVALQAREYRRLLNKLDISVQVITGRCETRFAPRNPIGHKQSVISRLDFYHNDSLLLFANQFTHGPETEGIRKISDPQWLELFESHREKIQKRLEKLLLSCHHNTPVLIYNLISLRHAQPAAAAALLDIMRKYPQRPFISHSADPDAERPEKIKRIKPFALQKISAAGPDEAYSGGPYKLPNLYHIVLNPTQRESFLHKYDIPKDHIFEIPDFLDFASNKPGIRMNPRKIFLQFLMERKLKKSNHSYKYETGHIDRETVIFVSPVRPVYRKRLKEAMLLAREYAATRNVEAAFVVTHPDRDDKQYFAETIDFAEKIGLPYYHLGKDFSLETLDSVYENLAPMKTIGVVASSAGGWENALNEMARACIPFYMDSKLNSFKPLTEEIGMKTHGTDFGLVTSLTEAVENGTYNPGQYAEEAVAADAMNWIDRMLRQPVRKELIEHNYKKAYDYLSHDATMPKLVNSIKHVYSRHCKHKPAEAELVPA